MHNTLASRIAAFAAAAALVCLACCIAPAAVSAKTPNTQYGNISPLPGGGVAVNADGERDGLGAFQLNIPVAYTPRWGYWSLSAFNGGHFGPGPGETDNGSGILAAGFGSSRPVYVSAMQVSRVWDESKAYSAQISLTPEKLGAPAISVGMQDIQEKEEDGTSAYVVATKSFQRHGMRIYGTLGYGTGRFINQPFGGISVPVSESLNVAVEWDSYQINTGLGWRPGGQNGWLTLVAGYNGQAGFLFGASTAFDLSRR